MTESVVGLDGRKAEPADPEIVEALEALLYRAKAGQIRGIVIASVTPGGEVQTEWYRSDEGSWLNCVGAASILHARVKRDGMNG